MGAAGRAAEKAVGSGGAMTCRGVAFGLLPGFSCLGQNVPK